MTASAQRPARRAAWPLLLALTCFCVAGCASPAKLARKSHEQLAEGQVRKAYDTALKAVRKDPYDEAAHAALEDAGAALMQAELRSLRSTVLVDTVAAAEVALRMVAIRQETRAVRGVPRARLPRRRAGGRRPRRRRAGLRGARRRRAVAGRPKAAHGHFLAAHRFLPRAARSTTACRRATTPRWTAC